MRRSSRPKFFQQTDRLEIGLDSSRGSCRHRMQPVILKIPRPDRFRRLLYFRLNRRLHRGELEQIQLYCYHRSILSVDFLPERSRIRSGCSVIRSGCRKIKRKERLRRVTYGKNRNRFSIFSGNDHFVNLSNSRPLAISALFPSYTSYRKEKFHRILFAVHALFKKGMIDFTG